MVLGLGQKQKSWIGGGLKEFFKHWPMRFGLNRPGAAAELHGHVGGETNKL